MRIKPLLRLILSLLLAGAGGVAYGLRRLRHQRRAQ